MTRILLLSPYEPPPDGIASQSSRLVAAWDFAGHDVLVVSGNGGRGLEQFERIGSRSTLLRSLRPFPNRRTLSEIAKFEPDVVIVQFAIAAMNTNLLSVKLLCDRLHAKRIPVVVTFHEPAREYNMLRFLTRAIYRAMARVTDAPVVFSPAGYQALHETGLFNDIVEVRHGTKGIESISNPELDDVRVLFDVRKPLVLTLGFTSFDKGADIFIDAAKIISKNRDGNVQFLVAGSPRRRHGIFRIMERRDKRCQQRLISQAERLGNVDISFSNYVANENVEALLHLADVVVLPYRRITQSGIANLALSSQSVIVCSDLPGLRNDLGDAALYVKVGDTTALAKEVANLLSSNGEEDRSRMRDLAGHRASENTYAKVAEKILSAGLASGSS
jgi:glycosyltransferase involved in cell wall biosynthesis